jgi:hypothetical protein
MVVMNGCTDGSRVKATTYESAKGGGKGTTMFFFGRELNVLATSTRKLVMLVV